MYWSWWYLIVIIPVAYFAVFKLTSYIVGRSGTDEIIKKWEDSIRNLHKLDEDKSQNNLTKR